MFCLAFSPFSHDVSEFNINYIFFSFPCFMLIIHETEFVPKRDINITFVTNFSCWRAWNREILMKIGSRWTQNWKSDFYIFGDSIFWFFSYPKNCKNHIFKKMQFLDFFLRNFINFVRFSLFFTFFVSKIPLFYQNFNFGF